MDKIEQDIVDGMRRTSLPEILVTTYIGLSFPLPPEGDGTPLNAKRNFEQALWNLQAGRTVQSRTLWDNFKTCYPVLIANMREKNVSSLLPLAEGPVLSLLRRELSWARIEAGENEFLDFNDKGKYAPCAVFLLVACDVDLNERDARLRDVFKTLIGLWREAGGSRSFVQIFVQCVLDRVHETGITQKMIAEQAKFGSGGKKIQRLAVCSLAKGKLPPAEEYQRFFTALAKFYFRDETDDSEFAGKVEILAHNLFGVFVVSAALDTLVRFDKERMSTAFTQYEKIRKWFEDRLV